MNKMKKFFFDYEEIRAKYTKNVKSEFAISFFNSKSLSTLESKGEKFAPQKQAVIKLLSNLNSKQTARCLNYVLKEDNKDVVLKNENGEVVNKDNLLKEWKLSENEKSKECWHLMFSINEEKNLENFQKLESAVIETMKENFPNHSFVFAIHNHQNNPHIHLVLKKKNNLTKKKIHFANKGDIKKLFSKMRDDFSMALKYKNLDYTSSKKIERLDELMEAYKSKEKENGLSVDGYSKILLSQINYYNQNKENILAKINTLKEEQKVLRDFLSDQKKNGWKLGSDFFNGIKKVKLINKKISSYYRMLSTHNKEVNRIKDEFLRFESKIKPLLGDNFNSLETLKHLDKKIGKSKLTKKKINQLQTIRLGLQKNNKAINDFYSPLCEILKKNLTIGKLGAMIEEQKSINKPKVEQILLKEIEDRVEFYSKKLEGMGKIEGLSGQGLKKALFMSKEVDRGNKILAQYSSSTPQTYTSGAKKSEIQKSQSVGLFR